jgi:hypothetical protein
MVFKLHYFRHLIVRKSEFYAVENFIAQLLRTAMRKSNPILYAGYDDHPPLGCGRR